MKKLFDSALVSHFVSSDARQCAPTSIAGFFLEPFLTNCIWLTARLKMRMLVVFLIVLLRRTTRTTRRLPTRPITMTKVKRMGTMMGTIVIRVFSCSKSTSSSSSPSSTIIVLFIWTILQLPVQNFRKCFISEIFLEFWHRLKLGLHPHRSDIWGMFWRSYFQSWPFHRISHPQTFEDSLPFNGINIKQI